MGTRLLPLPSTPSPDVSAALAGVAMRAFGQPPREPAQDYRPRILSHLLKDNVTQRIKAHQREAVTGVS